MKLIKMLGLAALVALAAMAVSGATASVSQAKTVLCSVNETPCPAPSILGPGTVITAKAEPPPQPTLKAEKAGSQDPLPSVTCQKSEVEGTVTEYDTEQVLGQITKLNFLECTAGKLFNCSVEVLQLPYRASDLYTTQGDGTFSAFAKPPNEQPGARVSCPIVGLNCIFKVKETNPQPTADQAGNLSVKGGNPATITANQVLLKTVVPNPGNCLEIKQSYWDAVYVVTAPKPVFQSKDQ